MRRAQTTRGKEYAAVFKIVRERQVTQGEAWKIYKAHKARLEESERVARINYSENMRELVSKHQERVVRINRSENMRELRGTLHERVARVNHSNNMRELIKNSPRNKEIEKLKQFIKEVVANHGWVHYVLKRSAPRRNKDEAHGFYHFREVTEEEILKIFLTEADGQGSDTDFIYKYQNGDIATMEAYDMEQHRNLNSSNVREGGFFNYYHEMDYDLSFLGIFNVNQLNTDEFSEYHKENCLYRSLEYLKLEKKQLNKLRQANYQRETKFSEIRDITEELKITISIKYYQGEKKKTVTEIIGTEGTIYNLAMIEKHFFPLEEIGLSSYAIKNYEAVKNHPKWKQIIAFTNGRYQTKTHTLDSLTVVNHMIDNDRFKPLSSADLMSTVFADKCKVRTSILDYNPTKCIKYVNFKVPVVRKVIRVFFDFETVNVDGFVTSRECVWKYGDTIKFSHGFDCGKKFIDDVFKIKGFKEIHLIAHNAKFDFAFICQYLPNNIDMCVVGSRFISATVYLRDQTKVIIKDSMNFINNPLKDFGKMFNLNVGKGDFDHNKIKQEMFDENGYMLEEYLHIEKESLDYCIRDVVTLESGYNSFANMVSEQLGLNIDYSLTVSSLSMQYAIKEGCFEGVAKIGGNVKAFIMQSVYGGRVMTSENKSHSLVPPKGDEIIALDANSLYPSSCVSIDGFVKGSPKIIRDEEHFLNDVFINSAYYYVDIEITKVNKHLKMPLIAVKTTDSILYTNDAVGIVLTVGKKYLEDMIKYQQIEYKFIRGYHFNDGFNNKIVKVINDLYNTRNIFKADKNPAEQIYKLTMNSIYGKTLEKDKNKSTRIFGSQKDMLHYVYRNRKHVELAEKMYGCDKWVVRNYESVDKQRNFCHAGVQILDQSKHIMNKVICRLEEQDKTVFYTDTDSTYILKSSLEFVDPSLIGKELCQFKVDYEGGVRGEFVGKKSYALVDLSGHEHIRLKGVPSSVVIYNAEKNNRKVIDIYEDLVNGKGIDFDMTNDGNKFVIRHQFNKQIIKMENFHRIIKTKDPIK